MVEWKKMWEVTTWDKKFNGLDKTMQPNVVKYHYYLANELQDLEDPDGDIRILYTTDKIAFAKEEDVLGTISKGEVVTIPWGGNLSIKYYNGRFVTADNRIATSNNINYLSNKFLFYWMHSRYDVIASFYRGAGIKHPSMQSVLNLEIPIPPLSDQNRIVGILDIFTASIENLIEQIAQRQKQYEYYRNKLLTFEEGDEGVEWKKLGELCKNISSGKCAVRAENGEYAVYGSTGIIAYTDEYVYDKDQILIARVGANAGYVHIAKGKYDVTDNTLILNLKDDSLLAYLFFILSRENLNQYAKGGGQPLVTGKDLKELIIPIPSLETQHSIVRTLDTFESLLTNLKKERALRQKQYEYYREKLLTFA